MVRIRLRRQRSRRSAAVVSLLGIVVTLAMLPETKGRSLEDLNRAEGMTPSRVAASA